MSASGRSAAPAAPGAEGAPAMADAQAAGRSAAHAWWMAMRPRTLAVAVGPVAVGTAVALAEGFVRPGPALAALAGALLLQLGSNFANDVYDTEKGADTAQRLGPPRAVQLGLVSPARMKRAMWGVFGLAAGAGLYLISVAGWPVLAIGLVSIAGAVLYTGGPWPLGYHGLGELAVFLFFGPLAVVGTTYVQTLAFSPHALMASVPTGLLAAAVLVVNNLRDIGTDRAAGKRTLAVRLGAARTRSLYAALLNTAFALLPAFWLLAGRSPMVLLPWLVLPRALRLAAALRAGTDGAALNPLLGETARLGLHFSLLLAAGWVL